MNDDSAAEFFIPLAIAEKWMRGIDEASRKCTEEELVPDFNVGGRYPHPAVKVTNDKRHVLAMLGWYFLNYYTLEPTGVLVPMAKQYVAHADGTMP